MTSRQYFSSIEYFSVNDEAQTFKDGRYSVLVQFSLSHHLLLSSNPKTNLEVNDLNRQTYKNSFFNFKLKE